MRLINWTRKLLSIEVAVMTISDLNSSTKSTIFSCKLINLPHPRHTRPRWSTWVQFCQNRSEWSRRWKVMCRKRVARMANSSSMDTAPLRSSSASMDNSRVCHRVFKREKMYLRVQLGNFRLSTSKMARSPFFITCCKRFRNLFRTGMFFSSGDESIHFCLRRKTARGGLSRSGTRSHADSDWDRGRGNDTDGGWGGIASGKERREGGSEDADERLWTEGAVRGTDQSDRGGWS